MHKQNVLLLFSDEHRQDALGCYGHPFVKTPNLDKLASQGTRFTKAYTPSPICVPARAALATGKYVHKTRCWSNAQAYEGWPRSFGHEMQDKGLRVESIGKLHYRGAESNNGFDQEHLPLYIRDGIGWIKGLLRNHEAVLDCSTYANDIGPGGSSYTDYDLGVTQQACEWLAKSGETQGDSPWTLFVSWLRPHYPLTCPEEFYNLYPLEDIDEARFTSENQRPNHPILKTIAKNFDYDRHFNPETRQIARASYFGLCSFLDFQVGLVLQALEQSGQLDNTLIIYTSDHGDHNGDRGLWTKMTMYDESARIPLIVSGPDIPSGKNSNTPASLIDIYPSILKATGSPVPDNDGESLQDLCNQPDQERAVLSEYHDGGSPTGMFMMRNSRWKLNIYPGYKPELFDMDSDPDELENLATSPEHSDILTSCQNEMSTLVDCEKVNDLAFSDQKALIEKLGGVQAILDSEEYDFTPVGS